jgi:hypothetical protein
MNAMAHRKMRTGLVLAIAAAVTLLAIPAGFAYPMRSSGLVATTLGSQDPRDTAQSDTTAGLVPGRLGSPDPRGTAAENSLAAHADATSATPVQGDGGFSWRDAGIGAGVALFCVAGLGLVLAIRHNRRHVVSPA